MCVCVGGGVERNHNKSRDESVDMVGDPEKSPEIKRNRNNVIERIKNKAHDIENTSPPH